VSSAGPGDVVLNAGEIARVTYDNGDGSIVVQSFVQSLASRQTPIPGGMGRTVTRWEAAWRPEAGEVRPGDCVRMDSAEPNAPVYYVQGVKGVWLSLRHYRLEETWCAKVDRVALRFIPTGGDPVALRGPLRGPLLPHLHEVAWNSAAAGYTNSEPRRFAQLDARQARAIEEARRHIDLSPDDERWGADGWGAD